MSAPPRRILVVKLSSLGDLFHALPAVHQIRTALDAKVDWATHSTYAELVHCFPDVSRVISIPRRHTLRRMIDTLRALRREPYDLILDFQGLLKSALVARLARGRRRIGPSFHREGSRLLYSGVAGPLNKNRHAVEEILDVIRWMDLPPAPPVFPVQFPHFHVEGLHPRIAIAPRSRWFTKNWPLERFAEVGRALRARTNASLYIIGSHSEDSTGRYLAKTIGNGTRNYCGKTSLVEMGGLLQEMDLVLTVDSGPMHVAAALGKPVLALFGASDPVRTGPYGPGHRVLTADDLPCRPCRSRKCYRHDLACLTNLTTDRVLQEALALLKSHFDAQGKA